LAPSSVRALRRIWANFSENLGHSFLKIGHKPVSVLTEKTANFCRKYFNWFAQVERQKNVHYQIFFALGEPVTLEPELAAWTGGHPGSVRGG
jgi:hypothetical protein